MALGALPHLSVLRLHLFLLSKHPNSLLALSIIFRFLGFLQAQPSGLGHCKWDSDWYFLTFILLILSKSKKNRHTVFIAINAPSLLIAPTPLFSTFAKFRFRGFTSLSTANTFAIPGFRKMVHFSTSQSNIAYEK